MIQLLIVSATKMSLVSLIVLRKVLIAWIWNTCERESWTKPDNQGQKLTKIGVASSIFSHDYQNVGTTKCLFAQLQKHLWFNLPAHETAIARKPPNLIDVRSFAFAQSRTNLKDRTR